MIPPTGGLGNWQIVDTDCAIASSAGSGNNTACADNNGICSSGYDCQECPTEPAATAATAAGKHNATTAPTAAVESAITVCVTILAI
jgi:hypothetical protein